MEDSIKNEDGSINVEHVIHMLKKLSAVLTFDGIQQRDFRSLSLAQSIGIMVATADLGSEALLALAKDMQPASDRIQEELKKKNPKLSGLNSVSSDTIFKKNGDLNREGIMEIVAKSLVGDISGAIPDGVVLPEE
jgi:hypothetical protein